MQFKTKNQSHTTKKKIYIFKKYQNHAIKKKTKINLMPTKIKNQFHKIKNQKVNHMHT